MIFVTVGSSTVPFDRLLRASVGTREEELVVQHGASAVRPVGAECVEYLDYDEFVRLLRRARIVVTHAGVGSVMTALEHGRRPLVVPRLASLGEAVDDHQLTFARRADELGLVTLVEDVGELAATIAGHDGEAASVAFGQSPIEAELRSYIEECVGSVSR
jgi:beta-1,4-N-acetylglucosaminyltransferase